MFFLFNYNLIIMETTEFNQMIAVLNAPVIDEYNTKIMFIKRIMERNKYLGIEERQLKKNRLYFNDQFDYLYDQSNETLESIDHVLQEHCIHMHEERMKIMKEIWNGHKE